MSDVHCANQILRTPFATLLHWASVAFVCVTLTQAPVDSSISLAVEEHRSGTFNSSAHSEPICWEAKSPHEVDCFHDEPLTADPYPLTLEMLERASSRYTTTDFGLHRAFQRARRRGNLKVVAVGGSVTAGHDCVSPMGLANRECAWPHRLQQWCDERIEDFTCEVRHSKLASCRVSFLFLVRNLSPAQSPTQSRNRYKYFHSLLPSEPYHT